jgi:hypothetical protein
MPTVNLHQRKALLATVVPLLLLQQRTPGSGIHPSGTTSTEPTDDLTPDDTLAISVVCGSLPKVIPHPEQGGERITPEYLGLISEAECIWRFR